MGYSRFGTYCLSRVHRQVLVVDAPAAEQAACRQVPLARLDLEPAVRDDLARLGVKTIDDLMRLPAAGLGARFGPGTLRLVQLARGLGFDPLQPQLPPEPVRAEERFDEPETDAWRLLFVIKRQLHPLLARLAGRNARRGRRWSWNWSWPTAPAPACGTACARRRPRWTWCC